MRKLLAFVLTISLFSGVVFPDDKKESSMMKNSSAVLASAGIGLGVGLGAGLLTYLGASLFSKESALFQGMDEKKIERFKILLSLGVGSVVGLGAGSLVYNKKFKKMTPEYKLEEAKRLNGILLSNKNLLSRLDCSDVEKAALFKENKTNDDDVIIKAFIYRNSNGSERPFVHVGQRVAFYRRRIEEAKKIVEEVKKFDPDSIDKGFKKSLEESDKYIDALYDYIFIENQEIYDCQLEKNDVVNVTYEEVYTGKPPVPGKTERPPRGSSGKSRVGGKGGAGSTKTTSSSGGGTRGPSTPGKVPGSVFMGGNTPEQIEKASLNRKKKKKKINRLEDIRNENKEEL